MQIFYISSVNWKQILTDILQMTCISWPLVKWVFVGLSLPILHIKYTGSSTNYHQDYKTCHQQILNLTSNHSPWNTKNIKLIEFKRRHTVVDKDLQYFWLGWTPVFWHFRFCELCTVYRQNQPPHWLNLCWPLQVTSVWINVDGNSQRNISFYHKPCQNLFFNC